MRQLKTYILSRIYGYAAIAYNTAVYNINVISSKSLRFKEKAIEIGLFGLFINKKPIYYAPGFEKAADALLKKVIIVTSNIFIYPEEIQRFECSLEYAYLIEQIHKNPIVLSPEALILDFIKTYIINRDIHRHDLDSYYDQCYDRCITYRVLYGNESDV